MLGFGGFNTGVSQCYLNMLGSGGLLKHRCFTVLFKRAESGGVNTGVSQYYLNMLSLEVLTQVFHRTISTCWGLEILTQVFHSNI